ncbi:MAG: hypothetical protein O9302_07010 [Cyclobacteriaceae bacterium]|jgi:hypothetical protein|nr:hypothetical protein [Cytophagales bacterium]MCZ8327790.1 hypothetical protein [Cyclobacteriaceae bacterium]
MNKNTKNRLKKDTEINVKEKFMIQAVSKLKTKEEIYIKLKELGIIQIAKE